MVVLEQLDGFRAILRAQEHGFQLDAPEPGERVDVRALDGRGAGFAQPRHARIEVAHAVHVPHHQPNVTNGGSAGRQ